MNRVNQEIKSENFVEINDKEFKLLSQLIYDKIGINLTDQKKTLLAGRLQKILRQFEFKNFDEYYHYLTHDKSGRALSNLANLISTNHTFFGREKDHFDYFKNFVLPQLVKKKNAQGNKDIRLWSAGCSSGEEPYTLVMYMMEYFGSDYKNWDAGILATDISEPVLEKAKAGIYSADRLKSMDPVLKRKYFDKLSNEEYKVKDFVRREVLYRRFNLMNKTFPFKKPFDTIFCRNVMIYFDSQTRHELTEKFYRHTIKEGYLFIGHSETVNRETTRYKYLKPAVYIKL